MTRIYAVQASISARSVSHLQLDVSMTSAQKRDTIVTLLGSMPEGPSYQWLRSEFPEWFRPDTEVTDALRWALDQIEDSLDPDHRAALDAARATLANATGEQP